MNHVLDRLRMIGVVPVVTIDDPAAAIPLGAALVEAGLPCAEITARTDAAFPAIAAMTRAFPEMLVGAGTILDPIGARAAIEAGSRFLVSPGLDLDVVAAAAAAGVPAIPGVFTATEVMTARRHGCHMLKLFPAGGADGLDRIVAFGAVFADVAFVPTGGLDATSIGAFLKHANVAACGGGWITPRAAIAAGDFATIRALAMAAVAAVRSARTPS